MRNVIRWGVRMSLLAAALFVVGFFWFANSIETSSSRLPEHADAIVALTGGAARIAEADRLLRSGRGERLLITGVNKVTTSKEIKRLMPKSGVKFDCCVDIDRVALNTVGNAEETGKWVRAHGFGSLIVVTSSYHMPRSLVELRREMPHVKLIPHSVRSRNFRHRAWWRHRNTSRIVVAEYLKLVASIVRFGAQRISDSVVTTQIASASNN